jgi:dolichol-phosphate mannosyltransferase
MVQNTDDAYGFPPFRYFAPAISIGGEDYQTLRKRERELLSSFLRGVRVRRLVRDNFSWADTIPRLLAEDEGLAPQWLA